MSFDTKKGEKKKRQIIESTDEEDGNKEEELYCICRSPDIDRFMIACDKCMEWFHGDCVNVENKRAARKIKQWYCPKCLDANQGLQIVYHENLKKKRKLEEETEAKNAKKAKQQEDHEKALHQRDEVEPARHREEKEKAREEKAKREKEKVELHKGFKQEKLPDKKSEVEDEEKIKEEDSQDYHGESSSRERNSDSISKRSTRSCGSCEQCVNTVDCGDCDFCADMRKYGGAGKLRQKCRSRQCLYLSKVRKKENEMEEAKNTKATRFDYLLEAAQEGSENKPTALPPQQDHCYSAPAPSPGTPIHPPTFEREKKKKKKKKKKTDSTYQKKQAQTKKNGDHHSLKKKHSGGEELLLRYASNRQTRSSRKETTAKREKVRVKQCYGPSCTKDARSGSKYCSHECGVQLQIKRLKELLPDKRMQSEPYATTVALGKIQELKKSQKVCEEKLLELDKEFDALETLADKSKGLTVVEEEVNEEEERDSELDLTTYCVSCGIPLAPRIAFRHMEKCWAKVECLMSFGASMKSAGSLFCDTYMSGQGTYCKRLKVMCPEHYKERKTEANAVCGCPLDENLSDENCDMTADIRLCRSAKRKCTKHVSWYRLRCGEIDLKRVHQWWKLEDALEQERQLRHEVTRRNDVIGILLHHTRDHSIQEEAAVPNYSEDASQSKEGAQHANHASSNGQQNTPDDGATGSYSLPLDDHSKLSDEKSQSNVTPVDNPNKCVSSGEPDFKPLIDDSQPKPSKQSANSKDLLSSDSTENEQNSVTKNAVNTKEESFGSSNIETLNDHAEDDKSEEGQHTSGKNPENCKAAAEKESHQNITQPNSEETSEMQPDHDFHYGDKDSSSDEGESTQSTEYNLQNGETLNIETAGDSSACNESNKAQQSTGPLEHQNVQINPTDDEKILSANLCDDAKMRSENKMQTGNITDDDKLQNDNYTDEKKMLTRNSTDDDKSLTVNEEKDGLDEVANQFEDNLHTRNATDDDKTLTEDPTHNIDDDDIASVGNVSEKEDNKMQLDMENEVGKTQIKDRR